MNTDFYTDKWKLQPVRRCCKGSIDTRVAPALEIINEQISYKRILRIM